MSRRALERYAAKRTFTRTPEPPAAAAPARTGPLLFVVQKHAARRLHYDFRLELEGVLKSWAVPKGPSLDAHDKRMAIEVEDHPFEYASFEGVIPPQQYGAGKVIVWDCGVYSPDEDQKYSFTDRNEAQDRVRAGLAAGKLGFLLCGEKLKGWSALVRTASANQWLLIKHRDRFAQTNDVLARHASVLCGVSLDELTPLKPPQRLPATLLAPAGPAEALPQQLKPMLAEAGERARSNPQWRYEPKLDGYRVIAFVHGSSVRLQSRRGLDLTACFPQLVHLAENAEQLFAAALSHGFEGIMAKRLDSPYQAGRRSRAWLKIKAAQSAEFLIGGYTRGQGAREPLGALLLGYWEGKSLRYAGHVGSGLDDEVIGVLLKRAARLERRTSPFADPPPLHRPTRWLKPQLVAEVSFSEWTPGGALRAPVFVRLREDISPRSVRGRAGDAAARAAPQAANTPAAQAAALAPVTTAGEAAAVLEQLENPANRLELAVGGARIKLTNLDRVYWPAAPRAQPATTKRDLIRYLARVARFMLPHLADRPLTMIRMPEGIDGERFFQKHWAQALPEFVESVTVFSEHKDEKHRYLLANNLPTLLWLGQVGTLEFHVWHSRAQPSPEAAGAQTDYASSLAALESSILNYPDYLVFDIDPYIYSGKEAQGAEPELNKRGFAVGKRVAFWLRELLQQMSLEAIVKTSGKTGLHVFVPIERTVTFDEARHICETVGRHVMRAHPRDITMEWAVEKRTGKIFIDYNMNVRGKTLNVAYSPRGVPGAPVSMPLSWEELEAAEPMDFTISNVPARLAKNGDRWHDALKRKQSLTQAFGVDRKVGRET